MEGLIGFVIAVLAFGVTLVLWRQRREAVLAPSQALPALAVPQCAWLDAIQYERWQRQVARFLTEKHFAGCGGHLVSDIECRLIAGMACLLRLQPGAEQEPLFPMVRDVLIYPGAFLPPALHEAVSEEGLEIVDDQPEVRIGEHGPGQVVLSWADVALAGDAVNVVVHEFAHALDEENTATEGAPPMPDYTAWSQVMGREFARLKRHRRPLVLDPYGAQSPAEFWCVAAEAFFQQPAALHRHHPALFALLARYFQLSPPLAPPEGAA